MSDIIASLKSETGVNKDSPSGRSAKSTSSLTLDDLPDEEFGSMSLYSQSNGGGTTDFATLIKQANLEKIKAKVDAPMETKTKRSYRKPESIQLQELPFSPKRTADWSPRVVAGDAADVLEGISPCNSPIRRAALKTVQDGYASTAMVHNIEVDPKKVQKSEGNTTLPNVTSVTKRSQRALTADEIAQNTEATIKFFRNVRTQNKEDLEAEEEKVLKGTWGNLRKKFLLGVENPSSGSKSSAAKKSVLILPKAT